MTTSKLSPQTVLGLDPGTRRVGYGVIHREPRGYTLLATGILSVSATTNYDALREIKEGVDALIQTHRPDRIGIERLFFAKNQTTAIAVAEARGVLLLAASEARVPVVELTPNEIKLAVSGYGGADKRAVAKMVRLLLGQPDLSVIDDATDALAIALATARHP